MAQTRDVIHLAALLHDIGKFYQRADKSGVQSSEQIDYFHKKFESVICPTRDGRYTHKHVIWTAQFFNDFKDIFENNIDAFGKDGGISKQTVRWASAHHNPNATSLEECVVQLADHCSSGVDRTESKGLEDEAVEYDYEVSLGWDKFKEVRMKSIFENLLDNNTDKFKLPISDVELTKAFFPKSKFDTNGQIEYANLWKKFKEELSNIPKKDIKQLTDSILYLLEKYTVTIPSSTQHLPDVSLYEHSRSTAAYALCLYDYLKENNSIKCQIQTDEEPFLLIGGDLSGIQPYIYDIVGKGAAKNLKGRSFYLQLIVEVIVSHILEELNLYRTNIVYSSGGGFYILAPNTNFVKEKIPNLIAAISAKIRQEHGTKLYLAIDTQAIKKSDVFNGSINTLWSELTKKLSARKQNRFAEFIEIQEGFDFFFEPTEAGGETKRDAITGEEFKDCDGLFPFQPENDEVQKQFVKKTTFEQIRLGKILRENIIYQVITKTPISYWENGYEFNGQPTHFYFQPLELGKYYYFLSEEDLDNLKRKIKGSVDNATILKVNNTQFSDFQLTGNGVVNGFTFYGGNDLPRNKDDEALYFDNLAGDENVSFKRLGILRMDVDRLGLIFKDGFPDNKRTFSQYSTLSRSLDFFFKGYINTIWKENEDFKSNTFILYAGGDDLFIVGKWDIALAFSQQIQNDFLAWTCENPMMGISGGMAIVGGRYPIAKAATQSDEEEKRAKNHSFENRDKNAISFLGMPFAWGKEFEMVESLKCQLVSLIGQENGISKGFLGKISTLHAMKTEQESKGLNPSWRWLSAYDIGRAVLSVKSSEGKAFLESVKIAIFTNKKIEGSQYQYLDILNFAARWAELEMRS
ncbi:type III-A CRISPR-associated protein Cas10/Csm1 [Emticicia sp. W12TSBA100-4]|uniref:type III-A CRISPR-associated protein Cas10/Csm1 n=1 Tax=Emticicia sp. W12TSBA100-4 TaxID=3160965 RepID=UPI0033064FBE